MGGVDSTFLTPFTCGALVATRKALVLPGWS